MNTAILKHTRKAENAGECDRLQLVGNVQGGVSITEAAGMVNRSQPWSSKWWKHFRE